MVSKYFGILVLFCAFGMFAALGATDLAAQVRPWTPPQEVAPAVHGRGFVPPTEEEFRNNLKIYPETKALASNFSWVDEGGVTNVKDQSSCGSCWAFSATAQIESHMLIEYGVEMDLSEQQMIECNYYGSDCDGGQTRSVYALAINYGAIREAAEPYEHANGGSCTQTQSLPFGFVTDWNYVTNSVTQIKTALLEGPVACSVYSSGTEFDEYTGGCITGSASSTDHSVLIVGWDDRACSDNGGWIVKNSWGTDWGDYGYFTIQYGAMNIGSYATQIVYNPPPTTVTLQAPLGTDVMMADETVDIVWSTGGAACSTVDIWASFDGGEYEMIVAQDIPNSGSYTWTAANNSSDAVRFAVIADGDTRQGFGFSPEPVQLIGYRTRYVSATGSDTAPYDSPATAAHAIGSAVDACTGRDTVKVVAGDYLDTVLIQRSVVVEGGWNADFTVRDVEGTPTRIRGLNSAIRFMGDADEYSGVSGIQFYDCIGAIFDTPAYGRHGGAILCNGTSPVISDCTFDNCTTGYGTDFGTGGAIQIIGGSPQVTGCTFLNGNGAWGGALALFDPVDAVFRDNVFEGNTNEGLADGNYGGAVYMSGGKASFEGDVFTNNGMTYRGGAFYVENADLTLIDVTATGNTAQNNGGALSSLTSTLALTGTRLEGNQVLAGHGGAGFIDSSELDLINCVLAGNVASQLGGALSLQSAPETLIENCVFDGNTDGSGYGGFFVFGAGPMTMANTIVSGNTGGIGGSVPAMVLSHNDFWQNGGSDYVGITAGADDFAADPLFRDAAAYDFGLLLHSPCIDGGDPDVAYLDMDGSRNDLGCYGGTGCEPVAPAGMTLAARLESDAGGSVVAWDAATEPDIEKYVVYFHATAEPPFGAVEVFAEVMHPTTEVATAGAGNYYVVAVDTDGYSSGYSGPAVLTTDVDEAPRVLALASISPNPFNPATVIAYEVPERSEISLQVYDTRGRVVRDLVNETRDAGSYRVSWDGRDTGGAGVAAGVYLLRLVADGEVRTAKMVMAK